MAFHPMEQLATDLTGSLNQSTIDLPGKYLAAITLPHSCELCASLQTLFAVRALLNQKGFLISEPPYLFGLVIRVHLTNGMPVESLYLTRGIENRVFRFSKGYHLVHLQWKPNRRECCLTLSLSAPIDPLLKANERSSLTLLPGFSSDAIANLLLYNPQA